MIKPYILFFSIFSIICRGQENTSNPPPSFTSLAFSLGLGRYTVHDEIISPLIYKKVSVPFQLQFERQKEKNSHTVSVTFDSPKLHTKQNSDYAKTAYVLLNYNYLRTIRYFGKSSWGLGLGSQASVFYKHQFYKNLGKAPAADIFGNVALQAFFRKSITDKKELTFRFSYPLLSYVMAEVYSLNQPPAALLYDDGQSLDHLLSSGRWTNSVIDLQSIVTYRHFVHPRWDLSLSYWFRYYQYHKLPLVQTGVHQFFGSVHYKLSIK